MIQLDFDPKPKPQQWINLLLAIAIIALVFKAVQELTSFFWP